MNTGDRIFFVVLGAFVVVSVYLIFRAAEVPADHPTDKPYRDSLEAEINYYIDREDAWHDSVLMYRAQLDSLRQVPPQVIITDAVTSMHTAGVDSVRNVLLSDPR